MANENLGGGSSDGLTIEQIVADYLAVIYRFVFRLVGNEADATDVTQEVMVKVWKNLGKYDSRQDLKPWLFKIARNTAIDWLRKRRQIPFSQLDRWDEEGRDLSFADTLADLELLPNEVFAQKEVKTQFDRALTTLPINERTIVAMHLEEELTFVEIAEIVDRPLNTVKSAYRRALIKLRKELDKLAPKAS
ncbi:MAG: RNA polymerase sigma factor [Candidatus Paceibacterota bacterium]|jgi:RNA polymerase sigma-70 factor (ECF subfamily)